MELRKEYPTERDSMKAIVLDAGSVHPQISWQPVQELVEQLTICTSSKRSERKHRIADNDIVIVNKVLLDREVLQAAKNLKLICLLATGTNNIDLNAATDRQIKVCNARAYCNDSVAQHVMGLMLNLARSLPAYHRSILEGRWQKSEHFCYFDYPIVELNDKQLVLIGNGKLSKAVAQLARAFGMQVEATDSQTSEQKLKNLISKADFVSLHCPLTKRTEKMVDRNFLSLMKSSAYLINTARGPIIDEEALAEALQQGVIAGAALDVLSQEPPGPDHPLLRTRFENLILTPHIAWGGVNAQARVVQEVSANIAAFQQGRVRNLVNSAPN